ncbi:PREDICTED: uncharacterized protein LOC105452126 [Wasmannia auropunctata]|uniref:uncharacterized protein LOC105452126 n=1 Tax=Wasmannia auropunctata TaxID=64793 RepID=UPI0005ED9DD3|nr:PREDICTED: uncharacterized protein LOC105452126 [Wasmannia auropunctata]
MFSPKFEGDKSEKEKRKRWLFHATDFISLMYPCLTFCRILGIFPYKINASSFETSKPCFILSTIVMCIFSFCTLIIIYMVIEWFRVNDNNVRKIIEITSLYVFGSFIVIVTFILSGPRMRFLQTLLKISSRLPSESYQQPSILIHAKDILGFFYLLVQSLICYYKMKEPVIIDVFSLYITLLGFLMDMLYINCVCVLKACFKKINDDLANLFIMHDEPYSIMRNYHEQRNPLLLIELNALEKRHLKLSNTVQRLNIIFSPQLLATTAISFITITFKLYFNTIEWHNGLYINLTKQTHHTYVMVFIAYYFGKIVLIAWACQTGKNEVMKINTTIHDALNSVNDEEIKHELQLFSLQIMHCDNTFSAKGLNLDATLVATMTASITTYLLILIQFLIASHSCDGNTAINVTQTA